MDIELLHLATASQCRPESQTCRRHVVQSVQRGGKELGLTLQILLELWNIKSSICVHYILFFCNSHVCINYS